MAGRIVSALPMPRDTWSLVKFIGVGYCAYKFGGQFVQCQGPSMVPTLNSSGDVVFVDKMTARWRPIGRNEIVVARSPTKDGQRVCKRVIAVEGDIVYPGLSNAADMEGVTKQRAQQLVARGRMRGPYKVPPGHVWLEGDNLANSTDSRRYGVVPRSLVEGRCLARVWPLTQFQLFWGPSEPRRPSKAQRREALLDAVASATPRPGEPAAPTRQAAKPKVAPPTPSEASAPATPEEPAATASTAAEAASA